MADSADPKPKRRIVMPAAKPPAPPPAPPAPIYVAPPPVAAPPPKSSQPSMWEYLRTSPAQARAHFDKEVGASPMADLLRWLADRLEPKRMEKVLDMLKAGRIQLFAEVSEQEVVGVLRSQFDPDTVYSTRLQSSGHYCCTNQTLELCGGMRGLPCKHMLVLMVGLVQAKQLAPELVRTWVLRTLNLAERERLKVDNEKQSQTFIKYKGAEAGDIDWRPTETIPEDFYAL